MQFNFTQKTSLKHHISSVHEGNKPFQCNICLAKFVGVINLKKHSRIHAGNKPCQCPLCDASFIRNCYLTRHIEVNHAGEKPFPCLKCEESFTSVRHLKNHTRAIHKVPNQIQEDNKKSKRHVQTLNKVNKKVGTDTGPAQSEIFKLMEGRTMFPYVKKLSSTF